MAWNPTSRAAEGVETTLRAIVTVLTRDLSEALPAISPDIELPEPAELGVVLVDRKNFPSIEVQWLETIFEPDADAGYPECPDAVIPVHRIQLDLALVDFDFEKLHWSFLRYSKAIREILINASLDDTSGAVWNVAGERLLETGVLQNRPSAHLRRGVIELEARF